MRKALNSYLRIKGNESEKLSALEAQLKAELDNGEFCSKIEMKAFEQYAK